MFDGSYVALITPFKDSSLDLKAFEAMVAWHQEQGSQGVVIGGTTGEGFSLTLKELTTLIKKAREVSQKGFRIISGTGCSAYEDTRVRSHEAETAGADSLMIVTPPYVKPSQHALQDYYSALHEALSLPILLYNNPGRTGVALEDATLIALSSLPRIKGVKESTLNLARLTGLKAQLPSDFALICGEDSLIAGFLAQGGRGWISVVGNLFPTLCADLLKAWSAKDLEKVGYLRDFLHPFSQILFKESNPGPVKYAASLLLDFDPALRRPLHGISPGLAQEIKTMLESKNRYRRTF
jgi:4-hydroxy-tetrahydrodipicolinate synthase